MGSRSAFHKPPGNQGWNNIARWRDQAWPEQPQVRGRRDRDGAIYKYVPQYDRVKETDPTVYPEIFRT